MCVISLPFQNNDYLSSIVHDKLYSLEECKKIIALEGEQISSEAYGKTYKSVLGDCEKYPSAKKIKLNNENKWIYQKVITSVNKQNKEYFNFNVGLIKDLHVIELTENASVPKHMDLGSGNFSTRKITFICQLTEKDKFTEGDLAVYVPHESYAFKSFEPGELILFSSFVMYKITPVLSGTAHFLLGWADGPAFC